MTTNNYFFFPLSAWLLFLLLLSFLFSSQLFFLSYYHLCPVSLLCTLDVFAYPQSILINFHLFSFLYQRCVSCSSSSSTVAAWLTNPWKNYERLKTCQNQECKFFTSYSISIHPFSHPITCQRLLSSLPPSPPPLSPLVLGFFSCISGWLSLVTSRVGLSWQPFSTKWSSSARNC